MRQGDGLWRSAGKVRGKKIYPPEISDQKMDLSGKGCREMHFGHDSDQA